MSVAYSDAPSTPEEVPFSPGEEGMPTLDLTPSPEMLGDQILRMLGRLWAQNDRPVAMIIPEGTEAVVQAAIQSIPWERVGGLGPSFQKMVEDLPMIEEAVPDFSFQTYAQQIQPMEIQFLKNWALQVELYTAAEAAQAPINFSTEEIKLLYLMTEVAPQITRRITGKRILTPSDLPFNLTSPR